MNNYLIPANTKRGNLILGLFRPVDLIIFGVGVGITLLLLTIVPTGDTVTTILVVSPGLIGALLVAPVPHYHNVLNVVREAIEFINNNQKYKWRGWCFLDDKDEKR